MTGSRQQPTGPVAVVTGAGRGIGRAIAQRLAGDGFTVVGCGRSDRPGNLHGSIRWQTADVADSADVAELLRFAAGLGRPVGVVVNNAGIQVEREIVDTTDDDWERLVGTNCRGVFHMCRAFIPRMLETGGGVIINVGSISAMAADRSMAVYNASKGFVHALTRSIALDHGPEIRCNAVCPGWIMTEMAANAFAMAPDPEAAKVDAESRHPAGRLGRPEDIAEVVSWLTSDGASFVTGQCITADGGLLSASPIRPI